MTDRCAWKRTFRFDDDQIKVQVTLPVAGEFSELYELLPIVWREGFRVAATTADGGSRAAPWKGTASVKTLHFDAGDQHGLDIELPQPLDVSFSDWRLSAAPGRTIQSLRLHLTPLIKDKPLDFSYTLRVRGAATPTAILCKRASLPQASVGQPYAFALEADGAPSVYWSVGRGKLPPGLTLDKAGRLSGTPSRKGRFRFDLLGQNPYAGRPFFEKDVRMNDVTLVIR